MSGLTQEESRKHHLKLYDEGWAMVRSWDLTAEWERQCQEYEDGISEGQVA